MAQEIEKKFLVKGDFKAEAFKATRITQGYLSSVPERTVRVRVKGDKGFITIKGIGNASGAARFEWEKEIPVDEVQSLLHRKIVPRKDDFTSYLRMTQKSLSDLHDYLYVFVKKYRSAICQSVKV